MRTLFTTDPLDASDGFFSSNGGEFFLNPVPAAAVGAGSPFQNGSVLAPTPISVLPDEAAVAESAQNGPGGPGSIVTEASAGGFTVNLLFDAAAMAAPASFRAGI